jgi:hypothetical protein
MKLRLPNVTLVMIDGTCPALAKLALQDTLDLVDCGDVLVCSPTDLGVPRWIKTPSWNDSAGPCAFMWYQLPFLMRTDFALTISWDNWVIDSSMWTDEFLRYDYIGAPWHYDDGRNVGTGGWLSRRLLTFLAAHKVEFPILHPSIPFYHPSDWLVSRHYRPYLEQRGFRWPSEQLASRFMFETTRPSATSRHFMFHDAFNFPCVLNAERLAERVRLMEEIPYFHKKLRELREGRQAAILPRLAA